MTQVQAVVLGSSPTALSVLREVARARARVALVAATSGPASASRYLAQTVIEPDPDMRLTRLLALGGPHRPALIPSSDQDVDWVMTHATPLAERFALLPAHADGSAAAVMDKAQFYALCDTHGVAYPALHETTAEALPALEAQIQLPAMVKPAEIHHIKAEMAGRKLWLAEQPGDLARIAAQVPARAGTLLLQEIVPGPESEITLACLYRDPKGAVHQAFTARKLRQYPAGFGSAALVQSNPEPETLEITTRLLNAIGYVGIAASEFKRDPRDGQLKIIEINVRPSLWFSVATASGRMPSWAAVADLTGAPLPADSPQRDGVRWRTTLKDLTAKRFWARHPDWILPPPDIETTGPARARTEAVASLRDPMPLLAELGVFARKALARLGGRS